jgi:uncharacterized phage protein (TIGR02218 family)
VTFDALEISQQSSRPVEIYDFSYQGGHFRYTSAPVDVDFESQTWSAIAISRSSLDDSSDIGKASLTLTVPPTTPVAELFAVAPPDDVVGLVVRRLQYDDTDLEAEVIWLGRVITCNWPPDRAELRCENILTSMKQQGLRRIYGRNCPHVLYGNRCTASQGAHSFDVTLDTQVGRVLTSAGFDAQVDGFFSGGMVVWEFLPGQFARRGIKSHVGADIEITYPFTGIPNGAALTALPGCDHSYATCNTKFANTDNYGGFKDMVTKNPFGQNTVF